MACPECGMVLAVEILRPPSDGPEPSRPPRSLRLLLVLFAVAGLARAIGWSFLPLLLGRTPAIPPGRAVLALAPLAAVALLTVWATPLSAFEQRVRTRIELIVVLLALMLLAVGVR